MSDDQAMFRVQTEGDPEAFACLMNRWQAPILRLCQRMMGDVHRAQDVTQQVFVRLFVHRSRYVQQGKLSTYLWQIALNLCRDELRKRERSREERLSHPSTNDALEAGWDRWPSPEKAPDVAMLTEEDCAWVRQALDRLSPPHREVLVLRHYEGLKFREIAEVLEIPEGTVKSRMVEALQQLAQHIKHPTGPFPAHPEPRDSEIQ